MNLESGSEAKIINWERLLEVSDDDPDFAYELLEDFLADGNELISEIRTSFELGQFDCLEPLHALKGTSGSVGAQSLHLACVELEKKLKAGDPFCEDSFQKLFGEYGKVSVELKRKLAA